MNIKFELLNQDAILPCYAHGSTQDAGMDLYSTCGMALYPGDTVIVKTGLKMSMPGGVQAEIRSRSGMAVKGLVVANSPGTIDPSYRGEIGVILHNQGKEIHYLPKHTRVAQMVIMPYLQADIVTGPVAGEPSLRGEGGFGSTGEGK